MDDFENGAFGNTEYAQEAMFNYQTCMQQGYITGNYTGMQQCTEVLQEQYISLANNYYLNEAQANDPSPYNEEGWADGLNVQCFGMSGTDVFGNQESLLGDSTFLQNAYNPASSECASWAQYNAMTREQFYNTYIDGYVDISYEDWYNEYAQTWDADPFDIYEQEYDQGPGYDFSYGYEYDYGGDDFEEVYDPDTGGMAGGGGVPGYQYSWETGGCGGLFNPCGEEADPWYDPHWTPGDWYS